MFCFGIFLAALGFLIGDKDNFDTTESASPVTIWLTIFLKALRAGLISVSGIEVFGVEGGRGELWTTLGRISFGSRFTVIVESSRSIFSVLYFS